MQENKLARLSDIDNRIALVTTLEDAIELKAQATAVLSYYKDKYDTTTEEYQRAQEIKIRLERKCGEFLAQTTGIGEHGGNRKSSDNVSLESMGVTNKQSSRWQRVASIPDEVFEAEVAKKQEEGKPLTQAGLLRIADPPMPREIQIPKFGDDSGWHQLVNEIARVLETVYRLEGHATVRRIAEKMPDIIAEAIDGVEVQRRAWVADKLTTDVYPENNLDMNIILQAFKDLEDSYDPSIRLEAIVYMLSNGATLIPLRDTYLRIARERRNILTQR